MKNRLWLWIAVLSYSLLVATYLSAQTTCPDLRYDREDRQSVLRSRQGVEWILERMAELAFQSAQTGFSQNQRMALSAEYEVLKEWIGATDYSLGREKTNQFLNALIDPDFLGLTDAVILGDDEADSQYRSRDALDRVNRAILNLEFCLGVSYEPVEISGSPYSSRVCRISYSYSDTQFVHRATFEASRLLMGMLFDAEKSAYGVLSVSQTGILQANVDFFAQELELIGEQAGDGITRRTRYFMKNLFDPQFLGIDKVSVSGSTSLESQQNAQEAIETLREGYIRFLSCVTPHRYRPWYRPTTRR